MDDEQMHFAVLWAQVLVKLRTADTRKLSISLEPSEIATLMRGIRMITPRREDR